MSSTGDRRRPGMPAPIPRTAHCLKITHRRTSLSKPSISRDRILPHYVYPTTVPKRDNAMIVMGAVGSGFESYIRALPPEDDVNQQFFRGVLSMAASNSHNLPELFFPDEPVGKPRRRAWRDPSHRPWAVYAEPRARRGRCSTTYAPHEPATASHARCAKRSSRKGWTAWHAFEASRRWASSARVSCGAVLLPAALDPLHVDLHGFVFGERENLLRLHLEDVDEELVEPR
jgi:hypothetical protein